MNKIPAIFIDKELQSSFEKDGFVKIPLLNEEQVNELTTLFDDTYGEHATVTTFHHTTTDTQNPDLIYRVDTQIKSVFSSSLEKFLTDFKPLVGCFHIKEVGLKSETGIHQDPTFVDESKYCSANIWVALHDIDERNGNLFFIKGSNHVVPALRVTPRSPNYFDDFQDILPALAVHVPLKKGEAVIFNNATIHGATKNLSDKVRLASTLLICSAPADWLLYYQDENTPSGKIEEYKLDLDAFVTMPKDGRPVSRSFNQYITTKFPKISKEYFLRKIKMGEDQNDSYLQKVINVFRMKSSR